MSTLNCIEMKHLMIFGLNMYTAFLKENNTCLSEVLRQMYLKQFQKSLPFYYYSCHTYLKHTPVQFNRCFSSLRWLKRPCVWDIMASLTWFWNPQDTRTLEIKTQSLQNPNRADVTEEDSAEDVGRSWDYTAYDLNCLKGQKEYYVWVVVSVIFTFIELIIGPLVLSITNSCITSSMVPQHSKHVTLKPLLRNTWMKLKGIVEFLCLCPSFLCLSKVSQEHGGAGNSR